MQLDNISAKRQEVKRSLAMAFAITLVPTALAPFTSAHKVNVFAWVEGGTVSNSCSTHKSTLFCSHSNA